MVDNSQLDLMLTIIENPIRRKIIRRLSQEPSYPLEIAKELGIGQQLVNTHLSGMERDGFVYSSMEASPFGPKRRLYFLNQSACLTVSFGPHLYNEQFLTFDSLPDELPNFASDLLDRISEVLTNKESKLQTISELITEIDEKIAKLEDEKSVLLYFRNLAMKHASEELNLQEKTNDEKRVMHFIMDEKTMDIDDISRALNLRESIIRGIIEKLKHGF